MDADGEYVWLHNMGEVTRARMSYAGKYMWTCKGNVPEGQAKMVRVAMDGSDEQDLSSEFPGLHHDFTVLPDESVVFIAYGDGCDDVKPHSPDGQVSTVFNLASVGGGDCTGNSIHYFEGDGSIIVSDWDQHHYVKLSRDGEVQWVLGGVTANSFSGSGASWAGDQRGHHILAADQMVIFNNGSEGGNATVFEVTLDTGSLTATRGWEYTGSYSSELMGDVQRLGNTLITCMAPAALLEVDSDGDIVWQLSWSLGSAIGYSMHRESLYGPPPK